MKDNKILVSTDIGSDIDDALSLLVMLNSNIDIRGIITVNGDVRSRSFIAKHLVNLSSKDISIMCGEAESIDQTIKPYSHFEEWHVDDSFVDHEKSGEEVTFKNLSSVGIIENGVEELARKLSQEPHTVLSLGPLTNIAKLLRQHPNAAKNIENLYIMGCRFQDPSYGEHNIKYDYAAAQEVLSSEIPTIIIPGDLCGRYRMPSENIDRLSGLTSDYVKYMARGFMAIPAAKNFGIRPLQEIMTNEEIKFIKQYLEQQFSSEQIFGLNKNLEHTNIKTLLEKIGLYDPGTLRNLSYEQANIITVRGDNLICDLGDLDYGAYRPDKYFSGLNELKEMLKKYRKNFLFGEFLSRVLDRLAPQDLSIADVYVPYCFLHPEKLVIKTGNVVPTPNGHCILREGSKHKIIMDLDFEHFKNFLHNYLR